MPRVSYNSFLTNKNNTRMMIKTSEDVKNKQNS